MADIKDKNEASNTSDLSSMVGGVSALATLQGFKNDKGSFRTAAKDSPIQKHRKKKKHEDAFAETCAAALADANEVVRKRGNTWVLFDDDTGVEVGAYKDRKSAWSKQRVRRNQAKIRKMQQMGQNTNKEKQKKIAARHESQFTSLVASALIQEVAPYVFEQSPTSQDSVGWDNLVGKLSHEAMQSDPKFKQILDNLHKIKIKVLQQALKAVSTTLEGTGKFIVSDGKLEKTHDNEIVLNFNVQLDDTKKKLRLSINIQHNKPVLYIPEETKVILNSLGTDESKLLRAELMHVQETVFDEMHDVMKATDRRDGYLQSIETKLDKMVGGMVPIQIALLRNLLRAKYRGMK